jgi:uncharacterized protein (UPF0335 family)
MASLAEARSHNVPPEVFLKHYRAIRTLKDEQADAAAAVARAKKAAKNDGIDLKALKLLEDLAKLDNDEAEMLLRHTEQYAKWINLPIGMQGDFFGKPEPATVDAKTAQEQREWQAGSDGLAVGKAGHEREANPYEAGTSEWDTWDRSWIIGFKAWEDSQKEIAAELAANANGAKRTRRASADAH